MQDDAPAANTGTGNAGSGASPDPLLTPSPVLTRPSTLNAPPATDLPAIPDHELIRCVGRGAYGEVWLARHMRLGTLRAVKIIRRDQFDHDRPFQREFDGIRRYEPISRGHPNLVAILHVGGTGDCFFYVMELADPGDLLLFPIPAHPRHPRLISCKNLGLSHGFFTDAGTA